MDKFDIKSILMGIGIGIILTSMIGWIYSAGGNTSMTKEEIIEKAQEYGMIENSSLLDQTVTSNSNDRRKTTVSDSMVKVIIDKGATAGTVADQLMNNGLINDKVLFIKEIERLGVSGNIKVGQYMIKKSANMDDIIGIITKV